MSRAPRKTEITGTTATLVLPSQDNVTGHIAVNVSGGFDSGNVIIGYVTIPGDLSTFTEFGASGDSTLTAAGKIDLLCGQRFDVYAKASGSSPTLTIITSNIE